MEFMLPADCITVSLALIDTKPVEVQDEDGGRGPERGGQTLGTAYKNAMISYFCCSDEPQEVQHDGSGSGGTTCTSPLKPVATFTPPAA